MVARAKKRIKIYKGETPLEELQQAFKDEMDVIKNDAAKRLNCHPEELKCRFDSEGRVEVQRMTPMEMNKFEEQRQLELRKKEIRRIKGI